MRMIHTPPETKIQEELTEKCDVECLRFGGL